MDNTLPEFKRVDATGGANLRSLRWNTVAAVAPEDDGQLRRLVGMHPASPEPTFAPALAPPKFVDVEETWPAGATRERVLSERERGEAKEARIRRDLELEEVDCKRAPASPEAKPGPTMLVLNDDAPHSSHLYACAAQQQQAMRHAELPPRQSRLVQLATGRIQRGDAGAARADLTLVLSRWGSLHSSHDAARQGSDDDDDASPRSRTGSGDEEEVLNFDTSPRERVRPSTRLVIEFAPDAPLGIELEHDRANNRILVHKVHAGCQAAGDGRVLVGMCVAKIGGKPVSTLDDFEAVLRPVKLAGETIVMTFEQFHAAPVVEGAAVEGSAFLTGVDAHLAPRRPGTRQPQTVPKLAPRLQAVLGCDASAARHSKPISLQFRNQMASHCAQVCCAEAGDGGAFKVRALLRPGEATLERTQTCDHWLVVALSSDEAFEERESPVPSSAAPALALRLGEECVADLDGYSLLWQSAGRALSCVPQSRVNTGPVQLALRPKSMATKAWATVAQEVRSLRFGDEADLKQDVFAKNRSVLSSHAANLKITIL